MKWETIREKCSAVVQKAGKKTIVTVCTVAVLGCMVILNVILFAGGDKTDTGMKLAVDLSADPTETAVSSDNLQSGEMNDYFQSMSLNRQQARDEAMEVLLSVAESQTALEEAKEAALQDISKLAADMEKETNIETMILAKGFSQCIAVINNENCNVIVESDGLEPGEVAQITEIVYEQAGISPTHLKIVEKNLTET
ncbi:MAG: SpoIIIAH-like family protein [Clostridia bacterium]|nr:SpoIIIAH-like family protein [Clostridia bacterium]